MYDKCNYISLFLLEFCIRLGASFDICIWGSKDTSVALLFFPGNKKFQAYPVANYLEFFWLWLGHLALYGKTGVQRVVIVVV